MAKATDIIAQTFNGAAADIATAVLESTRAKVQVDKAKGRAQGAYTALTKIASTMGQADFKAAAESVEDVIRSNVNGFADAIGAPMNKKGDAHVIPSGFMSAKSVLLSSFDYGVEFTDEETGEIRPFGQIRKDLKAAKDAEIAAKLDQNDHALTEARATLSSLSEVLAAYAPKVNTKGEVESNVDDATAEHLRALSAYMADWKAELDSLNGAEDDSEAQAA